MNPNIRWRKKDIEDFAKMRKNFNAKVARLEKERPDLIGMIPERIYKDQIQTREDFNKIKKQVEDFTRRGSEKITTYHGQQIPIYEKKQIQRMVRSVNAKRAYKRSKLSHEGGTMGMIQDQNFRKLNIKRKRTLEEWEKFKKSLMKKYFSKGRTESNELYRDRYFQQLQEHLGPLSKPIINMLQKVPATKIVEGYYQDALLSISFIYDYQGASEKAEAIFDTWLDFLKYESSEQFEKDFYEAMYS